MPERNSGGATTTKPGRHGSSSEYFCVAACDTGDALTMRSRRPWVGRFNPPGALPDEGRPRAVSISSRVAGSLCCLSLALVLRGDLRLCLAATEVLQGVFEGRDLAEPGTFSCLV